MSTTLGHGATAAHGNGGLNPGADNPGSVRVRSEASTVPQTRQAPLLVAVPDIEHLVPLWHKSGYRYSAPGAVFDTCSYSLLLWLQSLPGVASPPGVSGVTLATDNGVSRIYTSGNFIMPGGPPRKQRVGKEMRIGSFTLARQFKKDHVVREPLEDWRPEVGPGMPSSFTAAVNKRLLGDVFPEPKPGPLNFVERFWKPVHMRVGFFPSRADRPKVEHLESPDLNVHWCPPKGTAHQALSKLGEVREHGIRKVSEGPAGSRLRQRARWVLQMNPDKARKYLGAILKGRWTPDLSVEFAHPRATALVAARGGEVKFLGGGMLKTEKGIGGEVTVLENAYVNAVHEGTCFRLYPELLAKLTCYSTLRKRDATLVTALRTRAIEWCKQQGFTAEDTAETLGPTVALAYTQSAQEKLATSILEHVGPNSASPVAEGWWSQGV